jgi:7-alpha-hydroxysteroid dehydrogenase
MVRLTPMARLGEVEDISACALYLASPASAYLTGDVIAVNGGLNALNMQMPGAFD